MGDAKTLAELSKESGVPARTIRVFYIARGLLDGPVKAARVRSIPSQHLSPHREDQATSVRGPHAGRDRSRRSHGPGIHLRPATAPTAWWQHEVDEGVLVWVRSDVSPWRMRQIRAAIDEMAGRLAVTDESNER